LKTLETTAPKSEEVGEDAEVGGIASGEEREARASCACAEEEEEEGEEKEEERCSRLDRQA
jgi:hypothetical protein